jgi:hypothetical protein
MDRIRLPHRGPLVAKLVLGIAIIATPYLAFAVDRPNPPPQSASPAKSKKETRAPAQEVIDGASSSTSTTY